MSTVSAAPRSTPGRASSAAWKLRTSSVCATLSMKTPFSKNVCGLKPGKSGLEGCDRKKALKPAEKRDVVLFVHEEHGLSVSKACTALRISRSVFLYKPTPRDDSLVITTLLELAERYPRYGFTKYFAVLRREGYTWNLKRVYRIYRQLHRKYNERLGHTQPLFIWAASFLKIRRMV